MSQENEFLDLFGLINLITTIKNKFSEKIHFHKINDIDGLQRRLDELTPPPDIETSEDVIIRINQLSLIINDLTNEINTLNNTVNTLTPSIGDIYINCCRRESKYKIWRRMETDKGRVFISIW